jgi:hypothetical protein
MTDDRTVLLGQRASLLARMRNVAASAPGTDPARSVQHTLAIDRYLARLLATTEWSSWVLKGGYANQLRAPAEARFTQDVDLKLDAPLADAQGILARAASTDLTDLFSFEFAAQPQSLTGPPGGGLRFPIRALLAGIELARFGADVTSKDAVIGKLERHPSNPLVVMLGLPKSWFPVYPIAQQFAEKLHAFSRPRDQENTRVKDLADMVWYIERYRFWSDALIDSCAATFGRRSEHPWPPEVPSVPDTWARPYAALRREMKIAPETPAAARDALAVFLQPVLGEQRGLRSARGGAWSPASKRSTPPTP